MNTKDLYETASVISDALPETSREVFANFVDELTRRQNVPLFPARTLTLRRWLLDAGWIKRVR